MGNGARRVSEVEPFRIVTGRAKFGGRTLKSFDLKTRKFVLAWIFGRRKMGQQSRDLQPVQSRKFARKLACLLMIDAHAAHSRVDLYVNVDRTAIPYGSFSEQLCGGRAIDHRRKTIFGQQALLSGPEGAETQDGPRYSRP